MFFFSLYISRKLKRLNLGGNELTRVPTQALSSLDLLKKLEMQENRITSIQEGDFEGEECCKFELFDSIEIKIRPPSVERGLQYLELSLLYI